LLSCSDALLAPDDSPFLDWDWLCAMEESKSAARKTGWVPHHLVVRPKDFAQGGTRRALWRLTARFALSV